MKHIDQLLSSIFLVITLSLKILKPISPNKERLTDGLPRAMFTLNTLAAAGWVIFVKVPKSEMGNTWK